MAMLDPATGAALPGDALQRVLFVSGSVHVYNIPPLASNRGHSASSWTADPARHIFTARLRVLETSFDDPAGAVADQVKVDLLLEDSSSGQLFAAAPYTSRAVVEPALDSGRFFAVTVRDPGGRKAVLGIGFEERAEAFDWAVALQEAARGLGWDAPAGTSGLAQARGDSPRDYSLKEGETITVNLAGSRAGKRLSQPPQQPQPAPINLQAFALPPPPSGPHAAGDGPSLAPPPKSSDIKRKRMSARDLGFDDGQFGEFA